MTRRTNAFGHGQGGSGPKREGTRVMCSDSIQAKKACVWCFFDLFLFVF